MNTTDVRQKYEDAFLAELAECKTMEEVKELITDTWSPSKKSYMQSVYANGDTVINTQQEDRINRLRAEVSARGRDIANLLEQIEAKDLEIAELEAQLIKQSYCIICGQTLNKEEK